MPRQKISRRKLVRVSAGAVGAIAASSILACAPAPLPAIPTATPKPAAPAEAPKPAAPAPAPAPTATPAGAAAPASAPAAKPAEAPKPAAPAEAPKPTAAPAKPAAGQSVFRESPDLAALVQQNKLPPVEKRLPQVPMVITPNEKIGTYGGRWRSGLLGKSDSPWVSRTMGNEPLVRWDPSLTKVIPNVAKKWDVSPDGKEYTFYLREGMRWSDGEPFTADDFVYWFEDVISNDELTKVKPLWMRPAGKLGKLQKVDEYTFKMKFEVPNGLLLQNLASSSHFWRQAKYAKQFHIKYNKDAVEKAVKDLKLQDWVAYYTSKVDLLDNPNMPMVFAWIVTQGVSQNQLVAKRNPYYWKVDTEGNQLPYIDELVYPVVEKVDVLVLKGLAGEIDMMDRHIATPETKAVFTDNKAKGGYDFFTVKYAWEGPTVIALNLNHKDPVLKEIFNKKDFRVALSHAINRKEIIDTIYVGDGQPAQPSPLVESPHYHEKLATQFLDFDVNKANGLLDNLGLKKGGDGMRLRPDGKPLFFTIEVIKAFEPWPETMEMVSKYWKKVGVDTAVKTIDRSLFYQRKAAYEHECMVWTGADSIQAVMDPRWYMPFSNESIYGVAWADWWRSGGKIGEEPPAPAKKQQQLYDELQTTADAEKQKALMKQILDIGAEQFWATGITRYYKGWGIVKTNFKNLPKEVWQWHLSNSPAQTYPEQYFFQK